MKLNLTSRPLTLKCGARVRVRPLRLGEFNDLLALLAQGGGIGTDLSALSVGTMLKTALASPQALAGVQAVMAKATKVDEPFTVVADEGERPGVLEDIFNGTDGVIALTELLAAALGASILTDADAKN